MKKNILAIIPARMGSSRFPGKPMKKILGKPMIGHVFDNVKKNNLLTDYAVATCDTEIYEYISSINGKAIMTSSSHQRASDRCAEAVLKLEEEKKKKFDIVVLVQGDEPMIHPDMITEAVSPMLHNNDILVINLIGDIKDDTEFRDPNCIKVVCDQSGNALYFSREPIPTAVNKKNTPIGKQICVIPFRKDFLLKYNQLNETPLEIAESIDMLRVLEHGYNVKMIPTQHASHAVDTSEDLLMVEKLMSEKLN